MSGMNIWDLIIAAVLLGVVFLAVRSVRRARKRGGGCAGCSGDCSQCGHTPPKERR